MTKAHKTLFHIPHHGWAYIYSILLWILIIYTSEEAMVAGVLNLATPMDRHSNELKQFERYETLMGGDAALWKKYLVQWNDCINKVKVNSKDRACREAIVSDLVKEASIISNPLVSNFIRNEDKQNPGYYLPDCKYSLDFSSAYSTPVSFLDQYHSNYFIFDIKAHNCKSVDFSEKKKYSGGASFEISASNIFHLVNCEVEDNFDDTYQVFCPLSKTLNQHHNSHMDGYPDNMKNYKVNNHHKSHDHCTCFALSIILDFEHYDAFSELDINIHRPQLNHILFDDDDVCICNNGTITVSRADSDLVKDLISDQLPPGPPMSGSSQGTDSLSNRSTFSSAWIRRVGESIFPVSDLMNTGLFSGKKKLIANNHSSNCMGERWGNFDYVWTGSGGTFPVKDKFQAYFSNKNTQLTELIGETHLRYTWDLYFYLYYGEDKLGTLSRKHGSVGYDSDIPALAFTEMAFATDAADYITARTCIQNGMEKNGPAKAYVIQTGSWDLDTSPLRNVLRNLNSVPHLIRAIIEWSQNNCSNDNFLNRLIYVSTQPVPRCSRGDKECEKSRGYRNNYAVAALNQWVLKQLLPTKSDIVYYIDASKIINPKMRFVSSSCQLYFLCHEGGEGKVLQFSGPGLALAGEILRCIMFKGLGHVDNINCLTLAQLGASVNELHHIFQRELRHQMHSIVQFAHIADGSQNFYYQIEGNIVREIEDRYTYDLIREGTHYKGEIGNNLLRGDNLTLLNNYPQIKSFKLPSRQEGKRYKAILPNKNLPVYVLNSKGQRRPIETTLSGNNNFLTDIQKEVELTANPVRNEDLLDIQLFNECNYIV